MATRELTKEETGRRRIAASCWNQGYRVSAEPTAGFLPASVVDCHPDPFAAREDGRVVIEIKRARSLRGGNDFVDLAQLVEAHTGRPLELVTCTDIGPGAAGLPPHWRDQTTRPGDDVLTCIHKLKLLGLLLRTIALQADRSLRNKTARVSVNKLAFEGIVSADLVDLIDDAFRWQHDLMCMNAPLPPLRRRRASEKASVAIYSQN
jgi:hypothetical protein